MSILVFAAGNVARIRKILLRAANADTKCDVEMCEDIFDPVIEIRSFRVIKRRIQIRKIQNYSITFFICSNLCDVIKTNCGE